jgi:hypothetical protein
MKPDLLQKIAKARMTESVEPDIIEMFLLAHKLGITHAECGFNGGGDSGDFDNPRFYAEKQVQIKETTSGDPLPEKDWFFETRLVPFGDRVYSNETSQWTDNPKWSDEHVRLSQMVKDRADAWVESTGTDWYNNDGGGGEFNIDFTTGAVDGHVYQNETVSTTTDNLDANLLGDEEDE